MAAEGHLRTPPIREALFDVRVSPVDLAPSERAIREAFSNEFVSIEPIRQIEAYFEFQMPQQETHSIHRELGVQGFILRNTAADRLLQLKNSGFTYNILPPYPGWDQVKPRAAELWQKFVEIARPQAVLRIGLRFINRVSLPLSSEFDFEEFLTAGPRIPESLPQTMGEFLVRVVLPVDHERQRLILTQFIESVEPNKEIHVVVDVDAFIEPDAIRNDDVFSQFENLRIIKNRAFFGALTDRALERYR